MIMIAILQLGPAGHGQAQRIAVLPSPAAIKAFADVAGDAWGTCHAGDAESTNMHRVRLRT